MSVVISAENISKKYIIGHQNQGQHETLSASLTHMGRSMMQRLKHPLSPNKEQVTFEEFWALKDINFEIKQGERVGIIGRNGAGKSTLLKVLSRITEPTTGRIRQKGRVANLLEVGTGFHPELSGRENIFLNGAVLGMTKKEIHSKFDEIVYFSGVEKFLDTPVKRYSSGMYVRLAFSVAAHLEPDILIVDEVLAVGDAAFQKKCLGKMEEVGREGRTVIFVSHNLGAIRQLCARGVLLDKGRIGFDGLTGETIKKYQFSGVNEGVIDKEGFKGPLNKVLKIQNITVNGSSCNGMTISPAENINVVLSGICDKFIENSRITIAIYTEDLRIFSLSDLVIPEAIPAGKFKSTFVIPGFLLRPAEYSIAVGAAVGQIDDWVYGRGGADCEWMFCTDVFLFCVAEEWSKENEYAQMGIVNVDSTNNSRLNIERREK